MTVLRLFNNVEQRFADGTFLPSHDYRLLLCSALTFDASASTLAGLTYTELPTALGYTTNGQLLANVAVGATTVSSCGLVADATVWTASGGSLEASFGLLFNDTVVDDPPVAAVDLEGARSAPDGNDFRFNWPVNGFIRWIRQVV